jgi:flagellar basal body rod protein FlgB
VIRELFGSTSLYARLQAGLDAASAEHRRIADVVATGGARSADSFGAAMARARAGGPPQVGELDLDNAMTHLADTQIRFDATAKLLQRSYSQLRTAINSRG